MVSSDLLVALAGLGTGLSLIVAIGAQNAFVLRQGLRGEHVAVVVAACAASDVILILAGVAGAGTLVARAPGLLDAVRIGGALFLLAYGALALRRALRPTGGALVVEAEPHEPLHPASADRSTSRTEVRWTAVLGTTLALTWLNPHVYLDTVLLVGSIAGSHGDGRWLFGGGAALASVVWFTALGSGAALLRPVFARPGAWRVLDGLIAVGMAAIAASLLAGA
ncbi:MAG: LysE/ArgO family amino acid transporter [Patulibacter minatonensis]